MLSRQLGRRVYAANADIKIIHLLPSSKERIVRPQRNQFVLFKTNALGKFGDRCGYTFVYNNVSPNALYEELVLQAKPTDTPIDLLPVGAAARETRLLEQPALGLLGISM